MRNYLSTIIQWRRLANYCVFIKKLIPYSDLLFVIENAVKWHTANRYDILCYYAKNVIIIESQILFLYFV